MLNIVDYRDSCASTDEDEDNADFHRLSNQPQEITDDDSESEFNRILEMCRRHREFAAARMDENCSSNKRNPSRLGKPEKVFDSEYYSLPAIEQLNIQVKERTEFKRFGVVESHINFLAKIRPDKDAPHLGYETILFDNDKKPVGEIFEIFGTVTDTLYALRFNDEEQAVKKLPIGEVIFYANADDAMTKPVFPKELAKLKNWDRARIAADSSDSEELFSDDEEEKRHLAHKRQKTRNDRPSEGSTTINAVPKKRAKIVGMNRLGRFRSAAHFNYPRQPHAVPYAMMSPSCYYMPTYPQFPPNFHLSGARPWSQFVHPPPPPPTYPPNAASFPQNFPIYFSQQHPATSMQNFPHQFFNHQGYVPQRPYLHAQPNDAQSRPSIVDD
ncbi:H/ACA ribonucleoprotein complex non-core subunit naf1 [Globodera pallida]|nr:H/ACA ribonucleoprotein complex non-core subunit naf1 [Globodera pallida]